MTENHLSIVLRTADYKDNDRMLTLITPQKGRISALARGVRKQGNALFGTSDMFCCTEFGFYVKNGRYIATQGILKNNFYNIRSSIEALLVATSLCEICELASTEEEENPRLFALLASALFALDNEISPKRVFNFFVIKLLDILGMRPQTDACVICGKERVDKINIYHGGAVCAACPGQMVSAELFDDIGRVLVTPSKSIVETPLSDEYENTSFFAEWITEALLKKPRSLKLMLDGLK